MVLDGLPDLYRFKYDSVIVCGLSLYLCSYKLDGSATWIPSLERACAVIRFIGERIYLAFSERE